MVLPWFTDRRMLPLPGWLGEQRGPRTLPPRSPGLQGSDAELRVVGPLTIAAGFDLDPGLLSEREPQEAA